MKLDDRSILMHGTTEQVADLLKNAYSVDLPIDFVKDFVERTGAAIAFRNSLGNTVGIVRSIAVVTRGIRSFPPDTRAILYYQERNVLRARMLPNEA